MAVYPITRYPMQLKFQDGSEVTVRPMTSSDADSVLAFFLRIPEAERYFLKEDVVAPETIQGWVRTLDYNRALPLLAVVDGRIVGDAVLIRRSGNARDHAGEIRITVDPAFRGRGLGVGLMRELVEIAHDAELEFVLFELVGGVQDDAMRAAEFIGAIRAGSVEELVKDQQGRPHELVFLKLPLGKWWEWSRF